MQERDRSPQSGETLLFRYWGKAARAEAQETFSSFCHLLVYHCLDVAAVAAAWWKADRALRASFLRSTEAADEEAFKAWVLFFVALHDLGKWDARFQWKAPHVALELNAWLGKPDLQAARGFDHGEAGYGWFVAEADALELPEEAYAWMQGVAGHHGRLPRSAEIRKPNASAGSVDRRARAEWIGLLRKLFLAGIDPQGLPPDPPPLLAGFCSVCDWVGSDSGHFAYVSEPVDPETYYTSRLEVAARALRENGLLCSSLPAGSGGMRHLYEHLSPRGIQRIADSWPVEPGLTLLEAPTGSGKTEAALAYASRLLAEGYAESIIFALPTQATANAMLARLESIAGTLFPNGGNVVLAHGKARFNNDFQRLKALASKETAQGAEEALAQCTRWLGSSRKRVFLGQIGVCTIDQVLLSVLPVRHHFVRAFGVRKSVLIVDEIHAYDSYMNGLLDIVLQGQRESGGSAVLLSATLPRHRRTEILESWGPRHVQVPLSETMSPYPLVSHRGAGGTDQWESPEPAPERSVAVEPLTSEEVLPDAPLLARAIEAVRAGARVAIICNLVADAQKIARRILGLAPGIPLDLFHSRFRFMDRDAVEQRVLSTCGKGAPAGIGRMVVATQVIEQSLDLDFDWMITQLCPVDLLFQRLGRLHRHLRERPTGFTSPRATILLPPSRDYGLHGLVYGDARVLWRTEELLRRHDRILFPEAYRRWIEEVYDPAPHEDEPQAIAEAHEKHRLEEESKRFCARTLARGDINVYGDTDRNVTVLTRDGEMSLQVVPVVMRDGGHRLLDGRALDDLNEWERDEQLNLNAVPVPKSWGRALPEPDSDGHLYLAMEERHPNAWRSVADKGPFTYDPFFGLEKIDHESAD